MDEHVAEIIEKSWAELEAIEHGGALYFPDKLVRVRKDGTREETPIALKPLRAHEERAARIEARKWAQSEGLDPDKDPLHFDDMDTMCQLVRGIRSPTSPFESFEPDPKRLERVYDRGCLEQLYGKLKAYSRKVDPRESEISEEGVIALAAAIVSKRDISPLHGFDGRSQSDFIIGMADLLVSWARSKFLQRSSESSTPDE